MKDRAGANNRNRDKKEKKRKLEGGSRKKE